MTIAKECTFNYIGLRAVKPTLAYEKKKLLDFDFGIELSKDYTCAILS
jgi:hypothetical protein